MSQTPRPTNNKSGTFKKQLAALESRFLEQIDCVQASVREIKLIALAMKKLADTIGAVQRREKSSIR